MLPIHTVTPALAVDSCSTIDGREYRLRYAPDWIVTFVSDSGAGMRGYPYLVQGINANHKLGEYGHMFAWLMPDGFWNEPRFDLRSAVYLPGIRQRHPCDNMTV